METTVRKDWPPVNLVKSDSRLFGCVGTGRAPAGPGASESELNRHKQQLSPSAAVQ